MYAHDIRVPVPRLEVYGFVPLFRTRSAIVPALSRCAAIALGAPHCICDDTILDDCAHRLGLHRPVQTKKKRRKSGRHTRQPEGRDWAVRSVLRRQGTAPSRTRASAIHCLYTYGHECCERCTAMHTCCSSAAVASAGRVSTLATCRNSCEAIDCAPAEANRRAAGNRCMLMHTWIAHRYAHDGEQIALCDLSQGGAVDWQQRRAAAARHATPRQ